MFDKHSWQSYGKGRKASTLEINVKDLNEQTIDQLYLRRGKDIDNKRLLKRIEKHGFNLKILGEVNDEKDIEEEKQKEHDWLS